MRDEEVLDLTEDSDGEQKLKSEPLTEESDEEEKLYSEPITPIPEDSDGERKLKSEPLTEESDEEEKLYSEPIAPIKDHNYPSDSESGEPSGLQKSPSGRFIRNIDKCLDKAITEIKKGHSLVAVASQYGIPQEVLYNKLVSRSLPRETDLLTPSEEKSLVKWIVKANKSNNLIFKQDLMEKVGKLKKVMKITPIFAKSKFGRMWYDYFVKSHPEIYENEGLLLKSDKFVACTLSEDSLYKQQVSTPDSEDFDILTKEEEETLVNWIITSNESNSLVFKYQLMRRVVKVSKVAKSIPGFVKSKFGRLWYEHFLKNHPEIYENDELLLPSENVPDQKSNQWPDIKVEVEEDIKLANDIFKTSTDPVSMKKHLDALLLSYGIKNAIVVLHDFRKEKHSPYGLNGKVKSENGDQETIKNDVDNFMKEDNQLKNEPSEEYLDTIKSESSFEYLDESGIESDRYSSDKEDDASFKPYLDLKERKKKSRSSKDKPVCKKCARSFCNIAKLKRHMLTIHPASERHDVTCSHCYKKFPSKYHLSVHMKNVHTTTYHECEECGKQYKFRSSMRSHQRAVHEGLESVDVFFCDFCEKEFKYKKSLEAHILYGHLKEKKKFSCNICKMSFVKHSLMLRHKLRHSKIKPMACVLCKKTYSRKYLLREHIKVCPKAENMINITSKCNDISEEYLSKIIID